MKVIFVHVLLQWKGYLGWFVIRALYQSHGRCDRNQRIEIFFRAVEIGLYANSHVWMGLARAAIKLQRRVHIGTLLDIDPQSFFCRRVFDQLCKISETEFLVQIETELREFYGDFSRKVRIANLIEDIEIMFGDFLSFGAV